MRNSRPYIIKGHTCINGIVLGRVIKNNNILNEEDNIQVLDSEHMDLFKVGYSGYLFQRYDIPQEIEDYLKDNLVPYMTGIEINYIDEEDIIEINYIINTLRVLYRSNSRENVLVVTNQCNNNCIMCPDSLAVRNTRENVRLEKLKKLVSLMKSDTPYICITGGEPTLLRGKLFDLLDECKDRLNYTQFMMLTNGRMFYYRAYSKEFIKHRPNNMIIAIPIHGHSSEIHDYITHCKGSFNQTIEGIKNLYILGEPIEIRIVINKLNYTYLVDIAKLLADNFPNLYRVNLMSMEMLGNALTNADTVWIDFDQIQNYITESVRILMKKGIKTYLYNFPLCCVSENLWSITMKSISSHKVGYKEECSICKVRNRCGGYFNSTMKFKSLKAKPI